MIKHKMAIHNANEHLTRLYNTIVNTFTKPHACSVERLKDRQALLAVLAVCLTSSF